MESIVLNKAKEKDETALDEGGVNEAQLKLLIPEECSASRAESTTIVAR
jgi:hypothetical protein